VSKVAIDGAAAQIANLVEKASAGV